MKSIYGDESLQVPEDVKVTIKSRNITVEGPRGTLNKSLKHINMDIKVSKNKNGQLVQFVVWHGGRKHNACLRTVKSIIENMIIGVTKGFQYKMRAAYAHFPITVVPAGDNKSVEIRNFLGEKNVRTVNMLDGVTIYESKGVKDEYILEGNNVDNVSQSAASIHTSCLVRHKDIRKFLDGIYVSEKTNVVKE